MSDLQGVIVIITDDKGNVLSHGADFDNQVYGGFDKKTGQEKRARSQAEQNLMRDYLPSIIDDAIMPLTRNSIMRDIYSYGKLSITFRYVGY